MRQTALDSSSSSSGISSLQMITSCACVLYKEGRASRQLCGGLLPPDLAPVRSIPGWGCQALPQRRRRRPCPCGSKYVSDLPLLGALQSWRPWPWDEQQISYCTLRRSWQCIICRQRSWQLLCQGYSRHPGPPTWYQKAPLEDQERLKPRHCYWRACEKKAFWPEKGEVS